MMTVSTLPMPDESFTFVGKPADDGDQLLAAEAVNAFTGMNVAAERIAAVAFDYDAKTVCAGGRRAVFNRNDRPGNGCVDGNAQPLSVADLLTDQNALADGDQWLTRSADVLGHRNADDFRVQRADRRILGKLLKAPRMHAAEE